MLKKFVIFIIALVLILSIILSIVFYMGGGLVISIMIVRVIEELNGGSELFEKDSLYIEQALQEKNYRICEKVSSGYFLIDDKPRAYCYEEVIRYTLDEKLCEIDEIKKELKGDWQPSCYGIIAEEKGDINICDKDSERNRSYCIIRVAAKIQKFDLCDTLEEDEILFAGENQKVGARDYCKDFYNGYSDSSY